MSVHHSAAPAPVRELSEAGVSIWLDDLSRERLRSGGLADLIGSRAVVGVTWSGAHCSTASWSYVTSTLLSPASDATFNVNQTPPAVPQAGRPAQ